MKFDNVEAVNCSENKKDKKKISCHLVKWNSDKKYFDHGKEIVVDKTDIRNGHTVEFFSALFGKSSVHNPAEDTTYTCETKTVDNKKVLVCKNKKSRQFK